MAAGHNDLDKVRVMLARQPALLYAARPNLFVCCMLGQTELVGAHLEAFPEQLHALGPHGFTLLHHARVGGAEAEPLVEYLEGLGLTEDRKPFPESG